MSSVLPGFEYDIFISYRQKDNKGDGWVTEFVKQLKGELEATFKEDTLKIAASFRQTCLRWPPFMKSTPPNIKIYPK